MTRGHRQPSMTNEAATKTTLATDDNAKQGKGKCPKYNETRNELPPSQTNKDNASYGDNAKQGQWLY